MSLQSRIGKIEKKMEKQKVNPISDEQLDQYLEWALTAFDSENPEPCPFPEVEDWFQRNRNPKLARMTDKELDEFIRSELAQLASANPEPCPEVEDWLQHNRNPIIAQMTDEELDEFIAQMTDEELDECIRFELAQLAKEE